MNGHDLLAQIVRLEQRQLSYGTIAVLQLSEQVLLRRLYWSPSKQRQIQSELAEMMQLQTLGMARLHCLASRHALLNLLHDDIQEIGLDPEFNKLHSLGAVDDILFDLAGDLVLIARMHYLRFEYGELQKEQQETVEVKP